MDLARRRRWHRKMTQIDPSAPAVFLISSTDVRILKAFCRTILLMICSKVQKHRKISDVQDN